MKAIPSNSVAAAVRAYFSFSQAELAAFLGVTRGQVAHVEAGRRLLSRPNEQRLNLLAALLPPPFGEGPPAPPALPEPAAELLDPHPMRRRQKRCLWKAATLRWKLGQLQDRAQRARHWQQVLPRLQAALPANPATVAERRTQRWLEQRSAEAADELEAAGATTRALLRVRIASLELEAAELGKLLTGAADA